MKVGRRCAAGVPETSNGRARDVERASGGCGRPGMFIDVKPVSTTVLFLAGDVIFKCLRLHFSLLAGWMSRPS